MRSGKKTSQEIIPRQKADARSNLVLQILIEPPCAKYTKEANEIKSKYKSSMRYISYLELDTYGCSLNMRNSPGNDKTTRSLLSKLSKTLVLPASKKREISGQIITMPRIQDGKKINNQLPDGIRTQEPSNANSKKLCRRLKFLTRVRLLFINWEG